MVRFTLKQCSYFLAVVEHGGIAQAARALNISQPAIAQALDKLEALYGFKLLERYHAKGTELTVEGRAFLQLAEDLVAQADRVEATSRAISSGLAGQVRFGCFHTIAPFYLARLVKHCAHEAPHVEIKPRELYQDEISTGLLGGELDVALTYQMGENRAELAWIPLREVRPHVLLPPEHRLSDRQSVNLAELSTDKFVLFDGPSSGSYFRETLAALGADPPIAYVSRSMEAVRSAVANGLGFSLSVMRPAHNLTYDGGEVVSVPLADSVDPMTIALAYDAARPPRGAAAKFVTICKASIGSIPE